MSFTANRLTDDEQGIFDATTREEHERAVFGALCNIADGYPDVSDDEIDGVALDALESSLRSKGFDGIPSWEALDARRA